jgi:endonuclease/exonuclease/phosphatase family metal-dependent hydrolase
LTHETLKVASYNIRKGIGLDRRRDPGRVLAVLAEIDADVIALQEADRRFGTRASAIPYHMFLEHSDYRPVDIDERPHSIGWHGNALLVRRHMRVIDCHMVRLPTVEPRGAVMATLGVGRHALRVVGMHLDLSGLRRRLQAGAVLRALDDQAANSAAAALPRVLMGDMNEWRPQGAVLREFGHHHQAADTGPSFHTRRPVARLDRIFASRDLSIIDAGVHKSALATRASDHFPVWASLQLPKI